MGGCPCGGPKRSAAGKKSPGETFGRYEARPPAANAACVHNDTHTQRTAARIKPATCRSQAAKGRRTIEYLKTEWTTREGACCIDFEWKCRNVAADKPSAIRDRQCRLTPEGLICLFRTKWIEFAPDQTKAGQSL